MSTGKLPVEKAKLDSLMIAKTQRQKVKGKEMRFFPRRMDRGISESVEGISLGLGKCSEILNLGLGHRHPITYVTTCRLYTHRISSPVAGCLATKTYWAFS